MNLEKKMVKWGCFLMIVLSSSTLAVAQTVQYSRQSFTTPYFDDIKLVADISGKHHVLSFTHDKKTVIHVFDEKLQLVSKKECEYKFSREETVSIIPLNNYYLLSIRKPGESEHRVWRVNTNGNAVDFSERFQQLIERTFKKGIGNIQIVSNENKLFIVSHTRNNQIEQMLSTVVQVNPDFIPISTREVVIPLKRGETPKEISLLGESIFMLTSSIDSAGYLMQVLKSNLNDGKLVTTGFVSNAPHTRMSLMYNAADTSLLIYSWVKTAIFISKLDTSLNYKVPIVLIKNQFSDNAAASFLFLPGETQQCISLFGRTIIDFRFTGNRSGATHQYIRQSTSSYRPGYQLNVETFGQFRDRFPGEDEYSRRTPGLPSFYRSNPYFLKPAEPAFRLSVLDTGLTVVSDSLVSNKNSNTAVQLQPHANVVINYKSYLIFNQNLTKKKRGLLLVQSDDNNQIVASDIMVSDKYEYLLSQSHSVKNRYAIFPYTYKREVGLVKISMEK